ncbi:MAG: Flp pilus assembly complex ATPase component TadA [Eggerthellaceae bacterium]|nr:Flp pilus assembly complex ATPase component TadA [Eggerthellaceae bacterium]
MKYTRLGDLLVDAGVISQDQLDTALAQQKESKKRLGEQLIDSGAISERQLIGALTRQLGIEFIDLTTTEIAPEMTQYVSKNIAKKYSVVPVQTRGDELYLAMVDPLNFIASEEVKAASRKRVVPMIATAAAMEHAISELYGTEGAKRAIREMQQESEEDAAFATGAAVARVEDPQAAPSIRLVDTIIERGIADRVSDIHIEPREDDMRVRMRIDGILHDDLAIPKELQQSVTARIKIMCGMDVTERRVPQDGRTLMQVKGKEIDIRSSTLPTVHGEKIMLRLLDREAQESTPEGLGFSGENLEKFNALLSNRAGVILLVGPTGSGKSSTMFSMLNQLNTEAVNIVTLEDPVEYKIEGINQVQVNEKTGMTFASGLRSILRQDPDIIAVGEIRDSETADIAMRAAVTGHLVLSTVHTSDALSTIDRLHDLGVAPYMVSTALKGIISQRLLRRVCPHCKHSYTPTAEELAMLGMTEEEGAGVEFYRGSGCSECFGSGYRGRIAAAEILVVDDKIRSAIHTRASLDDMIQAVEESGFVPILSNCRDLVLAGITTVDEAYRTINTTD